LKDSWKMRERPSATAEALNDRAKLLYHRLVARRIRRDSDLLAKARAALDSPPFANSERESAVRWRQLLDGPVDHIFDTLIGRSADARWLRADSPFPFVDVLKIDDVQFRRRLWRVAQRASKRIGG
jgi:hypothetical protein